MYRNKVIPLKMNEQEVKALDRLAAYESRNRSELIREILRAECIKRGVFYAKDDEIAPIE